MQQKHLYYIIVKETQMQIIKSAKMKYRKTSLTTFVGRAH